MDLEIEFKLDASEPWISTPSTMTLMSQSRGFPVRINTDGLAPGAHFAWVSGADAADPARGPLFRLPVTVIVPLEPPSGEEALCFPVSLEGGKPSRTFITAPAAADYATVKLVTGEVVKGPHIVSLHCVPNARGDADAGHDESKAMLMLRSVVEWLGSILLRLPVASFCFLLLPVSRARICTLHTHSAA